jgi:glycosyltransferase involved in cell wall biosynthesis
VAAYRRTFLDIPVKIVRIIARLNMGGPARHVVWLTAGLPAPEFETVLVMGVVPPGEEDMGYFAAQNGVEPVVIREMSRELSPLDAVTLWKVYRLLCRERPDVVHTHTAKAGTVGRVAAFAYRWLRPGTLIGRSRRVRVVHTYHGHVFHSYYGAAKTKIFLAIERVLAWFTDRIVVISQQQREEIHGRFGVGRAEQFAVIPLGIDLSPYADWSKRRAKLRAELGAPDDEILVGIVGRLTEVKHHELFLRAAADYLANNSAGPKVRFVIVGDGHRRPVLEAEAERINLGNKLVFLGARDDPENFYPALDIIALTSRNEGTPLTLIEGMANARPVIATAVGGVVDLLGTAERKMSDHAKFNVCERGIAVTTNDAPAFSRGLAVMIADPTLRNRLGAAGESFVNAEYNFARLRSDIGNLYRTL